MLGVLWRRQRAPWASQIRAISGGQVVCSAMGDPQRHPTVVEKVEHQLEELLPPHHKATKTLWGGRFENPWDTFEDRSLSDVRRWNRERKAAGVPTEGWLEGNRSPTAADWAKAFPVEAPNYAALHVPPADAVQAVWVGHATLLVQMEGLTFLTDPVFSQRASPVQFLGPKRVVPPALTAADPNLPKLDFVVISHNHFDHLDAGSVAALNKRHKDIWWYVPLGLASWFRSAGVSNVVELDWWQKAVHPGSSVRVVLTPAQHWSWRRLWDRKMTLWGGWAVLGERRRFWFAGDTGYCPVFKEIGERLGPFDLAAIPIGAQVMEPNVEKIGSELHLFEIEPLIASSMILVQHIDPEEAVQIHKDVRSKRSVGMHCCTFSLTDEAMDEPPRLLKEHAAKAGLSPESFIVMRHGGLLATADGIDLAVPPQL